MDFKKQGIKTSVVACIIDDENRVLLTRRCIEPFCSQWVMPGGRIDRGESILKALHREVLEEPGYPHLPRRDQPAVALASSSPSLSAISRASYIQSHLLAQLSLSSLEVATRFLLAAVST